MKNYYPIKFLDIFNEDDSLEDRVEFLRHSIQEREIKDKEKIISYLRNGQLLLLFPDIVTDVLSEKEELMGSSSIYSDGVWLWKDYLIHYLEKYNIQLPLDFVIHAEHNNWQIPTIDSEREEQIITEFFEISQLQEFN